MTIHKYSTEFCLLKKNVRATVKSDQVDRSKKQDVTLFVKIH